MITKVYTIEDFKEMFVETMLNQTNKVTKVSDGSVLNGIAFGNAKLAQKNNKEIAILEGHLFPDVAYGTYLDSYARLNGIGERFGARQSSTYVRVTANPGTTYIPGQNVFVGTTGILFDLEKIYVIGDFGFGYFKVRSQTTGSNTNVDAFSINKITNPPTGHLYCVNEYQADFGSDVEEDESMRKRVKEGVNILGRGTIASMEQTFMKINENVLRVFYTGKDSLSRSILSILSVNGIDFNDGEINDMLLRAEKFLSVNEMRAVGTDGSINLVIQNVQWQPIDISMRLVLEASYLPDDVRKNIQIRLSKYLDYRFWKQGQIVQWDNMLELVKNTEGVRYVSDEFFYPRSDIRISPEKLPRIRGFQMLDINGNLIQDIQGILNPFYFPNEIDFSFQATALQNI